MLRQSNIDKWVALYVRLSRDDENEGDSNSISHQIEILINYCKAHGISNYKIYKDDGYSGTNFNRPGFIEMISDIESGLVSMVIVKDMSRFGRNYLEVGMYTEIRFPEMGVRFVAVHDNVDSSNDDNDFTPFRNIINEWYAKDTSKKIRAVMKNKGNSGERLTFRAIYGYKKSDDGKQWLVDEEAAEVVYDIGLYIKEGYGPLQIAKKLEARQIPTPTEYFASKGVGCPSKLPAISCHWNDNTVAHIMDHWLEYSGHTVNFRTQKLSYKSKKTIYNSPDKWVVFRNTHEAIWTEDIVEAVQAARGNRRRITKMGEMGLFSGLAFCADCGAKLYHCRTTSWTREQECYSCATYRSRKGCSAHYIRAVVLEELVLQNIQRVLAYVQDDEAEFVKLVQRNESYASSVNLDKAKKALQKNEVRIAELDTIIKRLYEDNILGKISDERFAKMSAEYEREQTSIEKEVLELRETISASESKVVDIERFLKTVRRYTAPSELTPMLVRELVDKIIVHAPDKSSGHRVQRIDIHYKFIGEIELSPEYSKYIKKTTA